MRSLGLAPTKEQVKSMMQQLDTAGKGYVTMEEFVDGLREKEVRFGQRKW